MNGSPVRRPVRVRWWVLLDRTGAVLLAAAAFLLLANHAESLAAAALVPVGTLAVGVPVWLRRDRAVAAFAVALLTVAVLLGLAPRAHAVALPGLAVALYQLATTSRVRTACAGIAAGCAVVAGSALPDLRHAGEALAVVPVLVVAGLAGITVAAQRRSTAAALEQQARAAADQLREVRLEVAREIHDVVAHGMSVVALQSGLASLVLQDQPGRAAEALDVVGSTSRQVMTEMRRLLLVLRDEEAAVDTAPLAPAPGVAELLELPDAMAASGLHVDLAVDGELDDLPPGMALTLHRVVQEALTNVLRHASTRSVRVSLSRTAHEVVLSVVDDGQGPSVPVPGHGITGMRERVAAHGGSLRAGPGRPRGFEVLARMPLTSTASVV